MFTAIVRPHTPICQDSKVVLNRFPYENPHGPKLSVNGVMDLLKFYSEATYTIFPPLEFNPSGDPQRVSLSVGKICPFIANSSEKGLVSHLITACNPFSIPLGPLENQCRHLCLANQMSNLGPKGLKHWPASGQDPLGFWVEPSWLVFNAPEKQIQQWMRSWQQKAYLRIDANGLVHLVQVPFSAQM